MASSASESTGDLVEGLRWTSATETAARVRAGELAPRDVVAAAIRRLSQADPQLNAIVHRLDEQALAEANRVAERVAAGDYLPLAGVPVIAKDDVPVKGLVVTHGSRAYTSVAQEDAEVIARVRAAGAVIIATSRTPEFCAVPFTESDLGGATRNPWNLSRTPGGSSGGSVASVAAGVVPMALGGDGGGSIRGPAAWTGLVGLMPTPGAVSSAPDDKVWTGLGVLGGFARTVADAAALYDVLLTDPQQLTSAITAPPATLRIASTLSRAADKPLPIGGPIEAAWRKAADDTAERLRGLGHTVETLKLSYGNTPNKFVVRYLNGIREEVLHKTDAPDRIEPGSRLLVKLGRAMRRPLAWAVDAEPERRLLERQLEGFDLLLTPTMPVSAPAVGERDAAPRLLTTLRAARRVSFLNTWNHLGWPGVTVPAGFDEHGMPTAALLTGRPGSEALLLQVAAQLEAAHPWPLGKAIG